MPHELNPRVHSPEQRQVLAQLYREIGFARSVLAYVLPDGRLKLIDGHLRAALTPEEIVDVDILDVSEEEARVLLLSIDPLARLVTYAEEELATLRRLAEQESETANLLWQYLESEKPTGSETEADVPALEDKFLLIIECASEEEQVQLLRRFAREGLKCNAKVA